MGMKIEDKVPIVRVPPYFTDDGVMNTKLVAGNGKR
jgi:hypothetical protein